MNFIVTPLHLVTISDVINSISFLREEIGLEKLDHFPRIKLLTNGRYYIRTLGVPCGSAVKNLPLMQEPQETQIQSLGQEDPLEKGMATHSSGLAWRIPWTEEPGGLQSMESQRIGHDCSR